MDLGRLSAIVVFVLGSACASQSGATRQQGPRSIHVVGNDCRTVDERGTARTEGIGLDPVPNAQLCSELKHAIEAELAQAGMAIVADRDQPHDLTAEIVAIQSARAITEGGAIVSRARGTVHVATKVAVARGDVADGFDHEADLSEEGGVGEYARAAAKPIAEGLLASSKLAAH